MFDTIYALASGHLPSGVAVLRISGPQAFYCLSLMIDSLPKPRRVSLQTLRRPDDGEILDRALVIVFPGPASFTGEDCVELHLHGSRAVVRVVFSILEQQKSVRMALQGEFTRRSFESGKLDLTEVEGLSDLLSAETEMQRKHAIIQSGGAHRHMYQEWRSKLLECRAWIEAELDFSDEDDIPKDVSLRVNSQIFELHECMVRHLKNADHGLRLKNGVQVLLMGKPNVGKSSLLNWLANESIAIVTDEAGTTRDLLEISVELGGYPVVFIDSAGIRDSVNVVEKIGVGRAIQKSEEADLVIWLSDQDNITEGKGDIIADFYVRSKSDLIDSLPEQSSEICYISTKTGYGMDEFINSISRRVAGMCSVEDDILITRERHITLLIDCVKYLASYLDDVDLSIELSCEQLRLCSQSLGSITGLIDVEDILGSIFSEFCVGK
ncbi:MAG: tRNA uridine-5-carboxymethylaminomethyl(34) synthesis GTPase MnmE [Cohaesibacteraceae bacterium]|nr:tRNA uridine-5-carboxymethylaminomethyl(34) synthesis GTPase MnmE [Cohaesibacteraceae bacterium]MBL4877064.1 tRNA uridine-5-carboxymethylaminomethyl(34) synthesis GTPase MnmE [Cohaesibacteraceae bacterium]